MFKKLVSIVLVLMFSSVVLAGEWDVRQGCAYVDGDLSEWYAAGNLNWHDLTAKIVDYPEEAADMGTPAAGDWKSAYVWCDKMNMLFFAATGTNSEQIFEDPGAGWNEKDMVEIYTDCSNSDHTPYNDTFDWAQQWVISQNTGGNTFVELDTTGTTSNVMVKYAASKTMGNVINYEAAIIPYGYLDDFGGNDSMEYIVDLAAGLEMGLCSHLGSRDDEGNFSQRSESMGYSRFKHANNFQDQILVEESSGVVPEPATIALLGIGGLALLRRKLS